ncbi:MAG: glycosyltransferase [Muribaculaceae bacterium]|nr:glycosyltransferase [Muribaculaceae bacterium]
MISFDLNFIYDYLIDGLLGLSLLATLWIAIFYCLRIAKVRRYARLHDASVPKHDEPAGSGEEYADEIGAVNQSDEQLPPLSVIVYCKDSSAGLSRMLPLMLEQKYPGRFEVIVTTDGRSSYAEDVVTLLSNKYRNLRMTYVPDEAHALSRQKLAMTLGVKAAKHDYVLLTDANVIVPSDYWLALMARHFADGKEIVIGICNPIGPEGTSEKQMASFDTLADTVTYLTAAISGHPYRGNSMNLAFLRRKFFDNHGFAQSVGYHHGIDDIFLSQIADGSNTTVEISADAIPRLECYNLRTHHLIDKLQHIFTGKRVDSSSRRFFATGSLAMWIWLGTTVACGVFGFPNLLPLAISLGMGLIWMIISCITWKRCGRVLGIRISAALLPLRMLWRPISNFIYRIRSRSNRSSNYTWAKGF